MGGWFQREGGKAAAASCAIHHVGKASELKHYIPYCHGTGIVQLSCCPPDDQSIYIGFCKGLEVASRARVPICPTAHYRLRYTGTQRLDGSSCGRTAHGTRFAHEAKNKHLQNPSCLSTCTPYLLSPSWLHSGMALVLATDKDTANTAHKAPTPLACNLSNRSTSLVGLRRRRLRLVT